jgi:hypothetical protein
LTVPPPFPPANLGFWPAFFLFPRVEARLWAAEAEAGEGWLVAVENELTVVTMGETLKTVLMFVVLVLVVVV